MGTQSSETEIEGAEEFIKELAVDVLARTLYGEARSEGEAGMTAVAHVVLNRVAIARQNGGRYWWGHDIVTVCQRPYQFSCWNHNDPNRAVIIALDASDLYFATCLRIARRAACGQLGTDITKGATHYHTRAIMPAWAQGQTPVTTIGRHVFYDLSGG